MLVRAANFCRAEAGGVNAAKSRPGFRPFLFLFLIGVVSVVREAKAALCRSRTGKAKINISAILAVSVNPFHLHPSCTPFRCDCLRPLVTDVNNVHQLRGSLACASGRGLWGSKGDESGLGPSPFQWPRQCKKFFQTSISRSIFLPPRNYERHDDPHYVEETPFWPTKETTCSSRTRS